MYQCVSLDAKISSAQLKNVNGLRARLAEMVVGYYNGEEIGPVDLPS